MGLLCSVFGHRPSGLVQINSVRVGTVRAVRSECDRCGENVVVGTILDKWMADSMLVRLEELKRELRSTNMKIKYRDENIDYLERVQRQDRAEIHQLRIESERRGGVIRDMQKDHYQEMEKAKESLYIARDSMEQSLRVAFTWKDRAQRLEALFSVWRLTAPKP